MDSEDPRSVTYWIEAAKLGNPDAGQAIFERYFGRLVEVSRRLVARTRRVEDEEDAAIQALFCFLSGISAGKFPDVIDRASLWPLLMDMVVKNSKKQLRKQYAEKRGGGTLRGESAFVGPNGDEAVLADYIFDTLQPDDLVMLSDNLQHLKSRLSEVDRQILQLKLECRSNREIATLIDRPPRTVDRRLEKIIMPMLRRSLESN